MSPRVAFGVPGLAMAAALVGLLDRAGARYVHVPPARAAPRAAPPADAAPERRGAGRRGRSCAILAVFAPVSVFWALFFQYGSSWTLQADGDAAASCSACQVAPGRCRRSTRVFVLTLIPLFALVVYPALERRGVRVTRAPQDDGRDVRDGALVRRRRAREARRSQVRGAALHVAWQIPQYLLLAVGEVLVSVTALEFAYSQAPRQLKSARHGALVPDHLRRERCSPRWSRGLNRFQGVAYYALLRARSCSARRSSSPSSRWWYPRRARPRRGRGLSRGEPARPRRAIRRCPPTRYPPQVKYIVGNEACERFSFYGMRSILTRLHAASTCSSRERDAKAYYHYFVMANYLTPLVGGWIADRFWGRYRTILWISLGYVAGHAVLAVWETRAGPPRRPRAHRARRGRHQAVRLRLRRRPVPARRSGR